MSALCGKGASFAILLILTFCPTQAQAENVTYTYDPLGRVSTVTYSGGKTITYAYDAAGNRSAVTVTSGGTPPNTPPIARPDSASISSQSAQGATLFPLANDNDPDGDPLTIVDATPTAFLLDVTIAPDGRSIFIFPQGLPGTEVIDYTISDGRGGTAASTITVTVQ